jgi:hypothetical protein
MYWIKRLFEDLVFRIKGLVLGHKLLFCAVGADSIETPFVAAI